MAVAGPTLEERATRAALRRGGRAIALRPIEEIRPHSLEGAATKSAAAYYLRPDGATIADALIFYPNGAQLPREEDPRGKFSANAAYYQDRQRRKGFAYLGPTLTTEGAKQLVQILEKNRPAEVERLEDEVALCEITIKNTDRPEVRDHERRRKEQLTARLARVQNQFDPDQLVRELSDIARAQRMANMPPQVLQVMREMLAAQGQSIREELLSHFQKGAAGPDDTGLSTQEGPVSIE